MKVNSSDFGGIIFLFIGDPEYLRTLLGSILWTIKLKIRDDVANFNLYR